MTDRDLLARLVEADRIEAASVEMFAHAQDIRHMVAAVLERRVTAN